MNRTNIEWAPATDANGSELPGMTWNPVTGCTKISEGCRNCYAERFAERFRGTRDHVYEQGFDLKLWPERLDEPLRYKRPSFVFANSMSDLFHDGVADEYIEMVIAAVMAARQHTFLILTKRPARMRELMHRLECDQVYSLALSLFGELLVGPRSAYVQWPLPNLWLGVSAEHQDAADNRIPELLATPASLRVASLEPLLSPVTLGGYLNDTELWEPELGERGFRSTKEALDWVIVGGETGPRARTMNPAWARAVRDECLFAGVPFFLKQMTKRAPIPPDLKRFEKPKTRGGL